MKKKLNFEIAQTKAVAIALALGVANIALSAQDIVSSDNKNEKTIVVKKPEQKKDEQECLSQWEEIATHYSKLLLEGFKKEESSRYPAPSNSTKEGKSLEKIQSAEALSEGALRVTPESPQWIREMMERTMLKRQEGATFPLLAAKINGDTVAIIIAAKHAINGLYQNIGDEVQIVGSMMGGHEESVGIGGEVIGEYGEEVSKFVVMKARFGSLGTQLADENMWLDIRTLVPASEPVDISQENISYFLGQSQVYDIPNPNLQPGEWIYTYNHDLRGEQNPVTRLDNSGQGGKVLHIPLSNYNPDSLTIGSGSSGSPIFTTHTQNITSALMQEEQATLSEVRQIMENTKFRGVNEAGYWVGQDIKGQVLGDISHFITQIEADLGGEILTDMYDLKMNGAGDVEVVQKVIDNITSVEEIDAPIPEGYKLEQNYPNPFNPTTTIKFSIPETGNVKIKVYDMLGREIKTLINKTISGGSYEVEFSGSNLPSGVYSYKLITESYEQTKKMILLK